MSKDWAIAANWGFPLPRGDDRIDVGLWMPTCDEADCSQPRDEPGQGQPFTSVVPT